MASHTELGNSFAAGNYVPRVEFLTAGEEKSLWRQWVNDGDDKARAKFLRAYLPFCQGIAMHYAKLNGYNDDLLHDLFGECQLEMVRLMEKKKFDPEQGVRFSSYAAQALKGAALNFLIANKASVQLCTTHLHRVLFNNYARLATQVSQENPDNSTHQRHVRIAALIGPIKKRETTHRDIADWEMRLSSANLSMDAPAYHNDDGQVSWTDLTPSELPTAEEIAESKDQEQVEVLMISALHRLSARERDIIEKRLLTEEPETYVSLGKAHGVSYERIRQIEAATLKKIRKTIEESFVSPRIAQLRLPEPSIV